MYDKLKKRLSEIVVEDEQKDVDQLEKVDDELTDLPEGKKAEDKKELPEEDEVKKEDSEEDLKDEEETKEPVDPEKDGEEKPEEEDCEVKKEDSEEDLEDEDQQEEIKLKEAFLSIAEAETLEEATKVDDSKIEKFAEKVAKKVNGREVQSIKIRKIKRSEYFKQLGKSLIIPGALIATGYGVAKAMEMGSKKSLEMTRNAVRERDVEKTIKYGYTTNKLNRGSEHTKAGTTGLAIGAGAGTLANSMALAFAYVLEITLKDVKKPLIFTVGFGKEVESVGPKVISAVKKAISEYTVKEDAWLIEDDSINEDFITLEDSLETVDHDADKEAEKAAKAEGEDQQEEIKLKEAFLSIAEAETLEEATKVDDSKIEKFAEKVAKKVNGREVQSIKIRKIKRSEYFKQLGKSLIIPGALIATGYGVAKAMEMGSKKKLDSAIAHGDIEASINDGKKSRKLKTAGGYVKAGTQGAVRGTVTWGILDAATLAYAYVLEITLKDEKKPLIFTVGFGEEVEYYGPKVISAVKKAISEYTVKEDTWLIEDDSVNEDFITLEDSLETVDHDADKEAEKAAKAEGEDQQEEIKLKEAFLSIAEAETLEEAAKVDDKKLEKFAGKVAKKVNGREVQSIKIRKIKRSEYFKQLGKSLIIPGALIATGYGVAKAMEMGSKKKLDSAIAHAHKKENIEAVADGHKSRKLQTAGGYVKAGSDGMAIGAGAGTLANSMALAFAYVLEITLKDEKKPLIFTVGFGKEVEAVGPQVISAVKKAIAEYTVKEDAWLIEDDSVNEDFVFLEDSLDTVEHDADKEAEKAAKAEGEYQQEEVPVKEDSDEEPGKITKEDIYNYSRSIARKFKAKKIKKLEIRTITKGEVLKNSKANILAGAVFGAAGLFSIKAKDGFSATLTGGLSAVALAEVFARLKTAGNIYAIEAEFADGKKQVVLLGALTGQALQLKNEIVKEVLKNHKDLNPRAYDNSLKESFLDFDQEETSKLIEEVISLLDEDSLDTVEHDADKEAEKAAKAEGEDQQEEVPVKESWILEDGKLVQIEEFEF